MSYGTTTSTSSDRIDGKMMIIMMMMMMMMILPVLAFDAILNASFLIYLYKNNLLIYVSN